MSAVDGKQKAASAHVEGSKPEDAHQQQNPALALSMEPSMSFLASNSDPDTDAQSSSSKADSLAADQSSAGKQRAVDADYSVSSHKAKSKSKKKAGAGSPVKTTAASAASPVAERPTQADATGAAPAEQRSQTSAFAAAQPASTAPTPAADGPASVTAAQEGDVQRTSAARSISSSSLGAAPAFLPPKPKPGGNRAKAARPATAEAASAAEQTQVMEAPSQQPLSAVHEPSAPAPQHQASRCRCAVCSHSQPTMTSRNTTDLLASLLNLLSSFCVYAVVFPLALPRRHMPACHAAFTSAKFSYEC